MSSNVVLDWSWIAHQLIQIKEFQSLFERSSYSFNGVIHFHGTVLTDDFSPIFNINEMAFSTRLMQFNRIDHFFFFVFFFFYFFWLIGWFVYSFNSRSFIHTTSFIWSHVRSPLVHSLDRLESTVSTQVHVDLVGWCVIKSHFNGQFNLAHLTDIPVFLYLVFVSFSFSLTRKPAECVNVSVCLFEFIVCQCLWEYGLSVTGIMKKW